MYSGVNGVNGTSGTSGLNGANGTSGTSGVNGAPGASGTSGTSGSSGVSGGGGCTTEHMLIASHSGKFQESANNPGDEYYIGDKECGWDACTLTVLNVISQERTDPISPANSFSGIPCPMDLGPGDTIRLCGIAFMDNSNSGTFGAALGFFTCAEFASGEFPLNDLVYDNTTYTYSDQHVCWEIAYTLQTGEYIPQCESFFVVGMNTQTSAAAVIKFSYTLHITRNCSSG